MGTAYTPGLTISRHQKITKTRMLPIKGEVLVEEGEKVRPDTVVARALLSGDMESIHITEMLGIEASELQSVLKVRKGDEVEGGTLLAETKGIFGLFKTRAVAPFAGTVEFISGITGHLGIRRPPISIEVPAYISGTIGRVMPANGVVIETTGALIQCIFGVGGERQGRINVLVAAPDDELTPDQIPPQCTGEILIGGSLVTAAVLKLAVERGAVGVVVGGIVDHDLTEYVGHEIGVAITGHEKVGATLILTEGFGRIAMAGRTFKLLQSLHGREASINGATQIRAGAMRPEIIVPGTEERSGEHEKKSGVSAHQLSIGTSIRIIRVPYFGAIARVVALPAELAEIGTGAKVRVLEAELASGERVLVPRANVEIMQTD